MVLTIQDIQHLSDLGGVWLSEEQMRHLLPQLENIFEMVGQLSAVDTTDIEYASHIQHEWATSAEGVVEYPDPAGLLSNVTKHDIEHGGIVLKTSLKQG